MQEADSTGQLATCFNPSKVRYNYIDLSDDGKSVTYEFQSLKGKV